MNLPESFPNDLYKLMRESVIDLTEREIDLIYQHLNDFKEPTPEGAPSPLVMKKSLSKLAQDILENSELFGIDFPYWFGEFASDKQGPDRIIIVGIDPLRNPATFKKYNANCKNELIIGTPYAVHDHQMREKKTSVYWKFIKHLAENNFVYLTDIYKCYFYHTIEKRRSYLYFEKNGLVKSHLELLKAEINFGNFN